MREAVSRQRPAIGARGSASASVEPSRTGDATWLRLFALLIVDLIVALLWLGILAWLLGRVLSDRFAWSQFLWWIPTPAALVVCVLGFLFAFRAARTRGRRRRRIALWASGGLALAIHFTFLEHRLLRSSPPAAGQRILTLAHWNMTLDNHTPSAGLIRSIDELDADVTLLTVPSGDVWRTLTARAAASKGREYIASAGPVLVYSRLPIKSVRLPVATSGMFISVLELDASAALGQPITLYVIDLPSNPRRPRMAMAREAKRLLDAAGVPAPDLVVGDFNMTRGSASVGMLFPNLTHAFNAAGHGYAATFPRRLPLYHIDHVLVNEAAGLRAVRYDIVDEGVSRHRAQKAWITKVD